MKALTWIQARALARAGRPVRRAGWTQWLTFETALWIFNASPRRVVRAADFGAAEFRAADWTDEQNEFSSPAWPDIGGPVSGDPPYGSDEPPAGDPLVTIALRTSLSPTGEGCLVTIPSDCTVYADVTIIGGVSGDGTLIAAVTNAVGNFTTTHATNLFNFTAHDLANGTRVRLTTTGGLMTATGGNLAANTDYFVRDANANDFKLERAIGGGVIDITSDGSGTHTIHRSYSDAVSAYAGYSATHTFTGVAISGEGDVLAGWCKYTDAAAAAWTATAANFAVPEKCPPAGWTRSHSNSVATALDGFLAGLGVGVVPEWDPLAYTAELRIQWSSSGAGTRLRFDALAVGAFGTPFYDTTTGVTTLDHTLTLPDGAGYVRGYANFSGATAYSITLTLTFTPIP
jgi:hypothetical protein